MLSDVGVETVLEEAINYSNCKFTITKRFKHRGFEYEQGTISNIKGYPNRTYTAILHVLQHHRMITIDSININEDLPALKQALKNVNLNKPTIACSGLQFIVDKYAHWAIDRNMLCTCYSNNIRPVYFQWGHGQLPIYGFELRAALPNSLTLGKFKLQAEENANEYIFKRDFQDELRMPVAQILKMLGYHCTNFVNYKALVVNNSALATLLKLKAQLFYISFYMDKCCFFANISICDKESKYNGNIIAIRCNYKLNTRFMYHDSINHVPLWNDLELLQFHMHTAQQRRGFTDVTIITNAQ